ncbi:probable alpha-aspartyl dipeptidase [Anopheles cruzii]|uniref:probable alpha-aspartyl dipeptidase n=1 Tax=Anopheles cruzii TaxID=68878 RepID=UPI0022EC4D86|nr:probable alpha-aspartyl dipeptidase [Anopheles cruzii]
MNVAGQMVKRHLFLMSSSGVHGYDYLMHAEHDLSTFLRKHKVRRVLFIPYARTDYKAYTSKVAKVFAKWNFDCDGIETFPDPVQAVRDAQAIFIGGGNTFLLLKTLYEHQLVPAIREQVLRHGTPYMGSSAGTNVATRSIHTTNDMPIVYPPTFEALGLVPCNINPHYLAPVEGSTHLGETRDDRINEFHEHHAAPVLGLPEGTTLMVEGDVATVVGFFPARLFRQRQAWRQFQPGSDVSFLLESP